MFEDVAIRFQETDKQFKESERQFKVMLRENSKETEKRFQETDRRFKETEKLVNRISKDIGHLGKRFGEFNEALVLPSLNRLFEEQFHCKHLSQRHRVLMNGNTIEIDLLAISTDSIYIIEIKSKYRKDDLKQLLKHIEKYRENTPEHHNKKIYGVIVATDYNKDNIKELERKGIYFISISDDLIKLHLSPDFTPRIW